MNTQQPLGASNSPYYNRNDPLADVPVIWLQLGAEGLRSKMREFGLEPSPRSEALVLELMGNLEPKYIEGAIREAVKRIREGN